MATRKTWSKFDRLMALGLYCELPFGKFHQRHPRIIEVAQKQERSPSSIAMKLCNFASLDPVITSSGRKGLAGASRADRELWMEFSQNPSDLMPAIEMALNSLNTNAPNDDMVIERESYYGETTVSVIQSRKGQNLFRKAVLSAYNHQCCITGINDLRFLVASHIKPWAKDEQNRLNPSNGLCLSTLYDRAFDIGLISLADDYTMIVSSELEKQHNNTHIRETFLERSGTTIALPDKFSPSPEFMHWHRECIFIR